MTAVPTLSVVVLSWNTRDLLDACLTSLQAVSGEVDCEVIVVDNASRDGSAELVAERHPEVLLVRNLRNDGYAIGNNLGARQARGRYLMLLNSDTEVQPGTLSRLVSFLDEHPRHAAVAPRLDNPDGSIQRACMAFPDLRTALYFDTVLDRLWPGNAAMHRYFERDFDHETSRDVDQPPGAAFVIRREVWRDMGGFDPALWLFFNDVDLCKRLRNRGWRVHYLAQARVLHHMGSSTSQFPEFGPIWHRNRLAYYRKHMGRAGATVAKLMTTERALEEVSRMRRAGAPPEARSRVWAAVREIWTG